MRKQNRLRTAILVIVGFLVLIGVVIWFLIWVANSGMAQKVIAQPIYPPTAISTLQATIALPKPTTTVSFISGCQKIPNYDRPPQPQIGHPSFYIETGVNKDEQCWEIPIKEGFVAVVGGFTVDGVSNGVYKAIEGPKTITVRVVDGFALVAVREAAQGEFLFRVNQAIQYNWARNTIQPLPGWSAPATNPPTTAPTAVPAAKERRPTGENQTLQFRPGDAVIGWEITLDNGKKCTGGNCYLPSAITNGSVKSGVINPWETEVVGAKPWNP